MSLQQNFSMPKIPFTFIKPEQCFASEDFKAVIQELERLNVIPGMALCAGEPGSGKTCAVSAWTETLNPNNVDVRWIEDGGATVSSFLKRAARSMDIAPAYQSEKAWQVLVDAIEQHYRNTRKKQVFVIDEAQKLPLQVLEQIRCLTNLGRKNPIPLSFILIAHREFLAVLKQHTMTALRRRIVVQVSMEGLTRDETGPYLNHHIKIAGGPEGIFDPETADSIFNQSRGLIRLINKIAIDSMWAAARKQQPKVTPQEVAQAVNEWSEI